MRLTVFAVETGTNYRERTQDPCAFCVKEDMENSRQIERSSRTVVLIVKTVLLRGCPKGARGSFSFCTVKGIVVTNKIYFCFYF